MTDLPNYPAPGNDLHIWSPHDAASAPDRNNRRPGRPFIRSYNSYWDVPTDAEVAWLIGRGVSETAMMTPTLILAANVKFLENRTFQFDAEGNRAFLFRVEDEGTGIDRVAWEPKRGELATWRGAAFALGQDSIFNPGSYFGDSALRVHRTPLEWLRAERDGVVIVQPQLTYAYLRDARRLSFADLAHAQQVKRWLEPPRPRTELFLEVPDERAAHSLVEYLSGGAA
jgi:hypothetical protein